VQAFNGKAKFSTWLTRIAINSALMVLRRKRAHQWEIADQTQDTEQLYAGHCRAEHLRQAISRLRPSLRGTIRHRTYR